MRDYLSPINEKEKFFFPSKVLLKLIVIYNIVSIKEKIKITKNMTPKFMYDKLNKNLGKFCGKDKYWIWCGLLEKMCEKNPKIVNPSIIKHHLKQIEKINLRPEKPMSWYKNPKSWLSNYDILNVMNQYKACKKYHYDFLGVFPIDFTVQSSNGTCVYNSFCSINIENYIKKGIKHIGFITNLDKHDEPGSHWTSTFIIIDPNSVSYGAYYYDSASNIFPSYLESFFQNVKKQCEKIFKKKFEISYNKKKHQFKNTECGVFSMLFQIRWINKIVLKKNLITFTEITANPFITDDKMLELRNSLFRPNNRIELKKINF